MMEEYYTPEFKALVNAMKTQILPLSDISDMFNIKAERDLVTVHKKWDGTPTICMIEIRYDDSSMKFNFHGKAEFKMFGYGFIITDDINNIEEWNRFLNKTKKFIEVTTNDYPEYTQSFLQLIEEVYNVIDALKLKGE